MRVSPTRALAFAICLGSGIVARDGAGQGAPPRVEQAARQRDSARADPSHSGLEVRVLDVGQGDAILVRDSTSIVLIDGGPDQAELGRQLEAAGIGRGATIDVVVLSHAHADHYQGLRELFRSRRRLTVRFFFENGDASPNAGLRVLRDSVGARVERGELIVRDADDPCADGRPVCTITMRGGAKLHIMRPDPNGVGANNRSVAVKLVARDSAFSMWLAGDAERDAIEWFERSYAESPGMDVDVLKANHHGSCNGVSPRYLGVTSPASVVASLAAQNEYGHMHTQAKAMMRAARISWYRTDQNGTVTIRVPGTNGLRYSVSVERGRVSARGPSDRAARCE